MAVASQCNSLFFIENKRLYNGLQLKASVSHTCLQVRKQLPVEIHQQQFDDTNNQHVFSNGCYKDKTGGGAAAWERLEDRWQHWW